ncbi:MAG: amidase [Alphaproteobacteria bacterium]|nr:MAG: amidase [Alphaproteobacteria bacterium]
MTVKRPSLSQMRAMADRFNMSLSDDELRQFSEIMEPYIQSYDRLDALPDYLPEVRYPRSPGYRPSPSENPLNAWYYKTNIKGAMDGPLRDKKIVLKDTVCLAGVPMMNGSSIMEGYTPEIDATIVTRILDAGAIIVGKSHCENLCLSGGSHTNATGPVHNPWKHGYMAGGSSSGSAALVASGEVDMAIAGDQGGSIRIPSSNCGVYGMKATHGLVPYTGIMPVEQTIDHVGPITSNVADNALFLEVLAGEDGLDPRQYAPKVYRYTEALDRGCNGLRIGILKEGFGRPESEADVDAKVREAAERFARLGAIVSEISLPEHNLAGDAWVAITVEGLQDHMMHGNCGGTNYEGLYLPSMIDHFGNWRSRADELSHSLKTCMFIGEFFQTQYRGRFYGKAQNLMRLVRTKYKEMFRKFDLLLVPTLPMKAQKIPAPDASLMEYVTRAFEMVGNTSAFNSGHFPAMSIPCGLSEGLPIGMMLVADDYCEMTIYQAAHAFEQSGDWRTF